MAEHIFAEHFENEAPEIRNRLKAIQASVERLVPEAIPCIAYKMPAYRHGRIFFYFAPFRKHIGIYPPLDGPADLIEALAPYRGPKGNLSFPHKDPLPLDLIERVIIGLSKQYGS